MNKPLEQGYIPKHARKSHVVTQALETGESRSVYDALQQPGKLWSAAMLFTQHGIFAGRTATENFQVP